MAKSRVPKQLTVAVELPKCPACSKEMTSPIFQCQSGHSLCFSCTQNLLPPLCPICSQAITQMRNWQLEEIVDKVDLKVSCPNKSFGCIFTMLSSEIQDHLKECIFRKMECPHGIMFGRCSWKGKLQEMLNHFKDKHPLNSSINLDTDEEIKNVSAILDNRFLFLLSQGKSLFLFTIKVDINIKNVYFAVQLIGSKHAAQKYVFEIHLTTKQDTRRIVTFKDHVFNDSCDINVVFREGKCPIMPLKMFSHFIEDKNMYFKIIIRNVQTRSKNKPRNEDCKERENTHISVNRHNREIACKVGPSSKQLNLCNYEKKASNASSRSLSSSRLPPK